MTTKLIPDQDLSVTLAPQMNLLINGGFEFWQRGTPLTLGVNQYGPDRWYLHKDGADVTTVTKITTPSNVDSGAASCQFSVTHTTSNQARLIQSVEMAVQDIQNKTFSFSMRVKTTLAGVAVSLFDGVTWWSSAPHSGSGFFETLSITATMGPSASGLYAWVGWWSYSAPVTGTVIIDSAMLVKGSVPVSFIPMHPADDLARCLRYFENDDSGLQITWYSNPAETNRLIFHFSVQKSAIPSMTFVNGTLFQATASSTGSVSTKGFTLALNSDGTAGLVRRINGTLNDAGWSAAVT